MEIQTYKLKQDHEEFKDLTENQLMAIAELCLDYYKLGQYSVEDDRQSDSEERIAELETEVDSLESDLYRASKEYDALEEQFNNLKDKYLELKNANNSK